MRLRMTAWGSAGLIALVAGALAPAGCGSPADEEAYGQVMQPEFSSCAPSSPTRLLQVSGDAYSLSPSTYYPSCGWFDFSVYRQSRPMPDVVVKLRDTAWLTTQAKCQGTSVEAALFVDSPPHNPGILDRSYPTTSTEQKTSKIAYGTWVNGACTPPSVSWSASDFVVGTNYHVTATGLYQGQPIRIEVINLKSGTGIAQFPAAAIPGLPSLHHWTFWVTASRALVIEGFDANNNSLAALSFHVGLGGAPASSFKANATMNGVSRQTIARWDDGTYFASSDPSAIAILVTGANADLAKFIPGANLDSCGLRMANVLSQATSCLAKPLMKDVITCLTSVSAAALSPSITPCLADGNDLDTQCASGLAIAQNLGCGLRGSQKFNGRPGTRSMPTDYEFTDISWSGQKPTDVPSCTHTGNSCDCSVTKSSFPQSTQFGVSCDENANGTSATCYCTQVVGLPPLVRLPNTAYTSPGAGVAPCMGWQGHCNH